MKDRGFVLVNVLLLIAALSVVAVTLTQITARTTQRLDMAQAAAQAPLIIDAGVAFASRLLGQDGASNTVDHRGEAWALDGFLAETALAPVRVTVTDLEGRMNLNRPLALDGAAMETPVETLILEAGGNADFAAAMLAQYAQTRSARAAPPSPDMDITYQLGDFTSPAALTAVGDVSTLADDLFSTLPRTRGININTAGDQVLAALPGMSAEALTALNAIRQADPVADDAVLTALLQQIAPDAVGLAALLETQSHWFEVETETRLNGITYRGRTILSRHPSTGDVRVHLHGIEVDG